MTSAVAPQRLAETVRRRLRESSHNVNAYWMRIVEDRDAYAFHLNNEFHESPVVTLVIRDDRFTNPNAILSDFVQLVTQNREVVEQQMEASHTRCGFILLSRSELATAQISSPIDLPAWFPIAGGTTISMLIEDLTWTADASLDAAETQITELCEGLLDFEDALLRRIRDVRGYDHRKANAFLNLVRREPDETFDEIIETASEHLGRVTTPSAFRPSLRNARSLVARLWGVMQKKTPEQMKTPSEALADCLDLPGEIEQLTWHESMSSVLRRPSGGEEIPRFRFARNVLLTVGTTCQLVTAAAHSDQYAHYPVPLLRALSYDLRRSLADAETVVRTITS